MSEDRVPINTFPVDPEIDETKTYSQEEEEELVSTLGEHHLARFPRVVLHDDEEDATETEEIVPTAVEGTEVDVKGGGRWEYAEHYFLGDNIDLSWTDGHTYKAGKKPFTLSNGVILTYGQIDGLGGDFYGTDKPISSGTTLDARKQLFQAAYSTLATDTKRQPAEVQKILKVLQIEVDALKKDPDHPGKVYNNLPFTKIFLELEAITYSRPQGQPTFLGLARLNFDHFGEDARKAYGAGHQLALEIAAKGELFRAYTYNALADHYLEDSFSAGHLRTPRRLLADMGILGDAVAKYMHDEDNAIGLSVKNALGESFYVYGDKLLTDPRNSSAYKRLQAAIQVSAQEIFEAWKTKSIPAYDDFAVWKLLPTVESARDNHAQALKALVLPDGSRRDNLFDRRTEKYIPAHKWCPFWTAAKIHGSKWWEYRMTLDGGGFPGI